jgi:transposase
VPLGVPAEVRKQAVDAYMAGEGSIAAVAERFGISAPSLGRYLRRVRAGESLDPLPHAGGPKPTLGEADREVLRAIVMENPQMPLRQVRLELDERTEKRVSIVTLRRALRALGIRRVRPPKRPGLPAERKRSDQARYGAAHRAVGKPGGYPTDLTDAEWAVLEEHFVRKGPGARPKYPPRVMLNAMFYVVRTGCAWRMLPNDFPPWDSVYAAFRRWQSSGRLPAVHDALRRMWREREGRDPEPSAVIVDSQSAPTTEKGGPRGYDANKKVKGRKRHIAVDTNGLIVGICIHAAHIQDRDGALPLLEQVSEDHDRICKVWFDAAYAGRCVQWVTDHLHWDAEVVRRPDDRAHGRWTQAWLPLPGVKKEFPVLPRRWVVERTFAWLGRYRRLSKDYEALTCTSAAMVWLAALRLLVRRLGAA